MSSAIIVSKQSKITAVISYVETVGIGYKAKKVSKKTYHNSLETAITSLYQIMSSADTNEHDRKYSSSLLLELYEKQTKLSPTLGKKILKVSLMLLTFGVSAYLGGAI